MWPLIRLVYAETFVDRPQEVEYLTLRYTETLKRCDAREVGLFCDADRETEALLLVQIPSQTSKNVLRKLVFIIITGKKITEFQRFFNFLGYMYYYYYNKNNKSVLK